jgi:hypothetical protein
MDTPRSYEPQTPQRVATIRETLPYQVTYLNHDGKTTILAAFQHERAYLDFLGLCYQASYTDMLQHLVKGARQSTIGIELGGLEGEVLGNGRQLPYDELLEAIEKARAEVLILKNHQHDWAYPEDSSSYCRICKMPGDI